MQVGELRATVLAGVVRVDFGGLDGSDEVDNAVVDVVVEGAEGLGVQTFDPILGLVIASNGPFSHPI